jgi:Flp pilus assembly pilin Flp
MDSRCSRRWDSARVFMRDETAATLIEYGVMLGVIAVVAVIAVSALSSANNALLTAAADAVSGL